MIPLPRQSHVVRSVALLALLVGGSIAAAQSATDSGSTGRRVDFPLENFDDTLFTNVDGAFRVRLDDDGDVWYSTEGGVVHVGTGTSTRELYTKVEGLPSSYTLGLDPAGDKVYVGTDLGVGVIDRATKAVTSITQRNSLLPDSIANDVLLLGQDLWIGTQFFGIAIWNTTKDANASDAWTFHNTSTTAEFAKPVRRIVPTETAVWVATDGDGVWRFDRATRQWAVTLSADGLPSNGVRGVAELNGEMWFATGAGVARRSASGEWRVFNRTHGMPSANVQDIDAIFTTTGEKEIFAATSRGLWQVNPQTFANLTLTQGYGILGSFISDNEPDPRGWLFATSRGISHFHDGGWDYYATGSSSGPSWGPLSFGYTSASVGDANGFLWFGSARGLSAYRPPNGAERGYWQNFGEWQKYPGSIVNWIDTHNNITWFATNSGVWGFEQDTGRWIPRTALSSRNLVYGLEADRGELWVPLFGDGLLMENLTTGVTRAWTPDTPTDLLPDYYLTDIRADGDGVNMWLGSSIGVIKLDRTTGLVSGTYTPAEGVPGNGVVFRVLPDGPNVWIGTSSAGVGRLDVASGTVTRVWNATTTPGFPEGEVRSLYREGGRLWVGTSEGLVRIDITSGQTRTYTQASSALVQNFVNGITSMDGVLYVATLSGVQRLNIARDEFLPMFDGTGVIRGATTGSFAAADRIALRIDTPRDGGAVYGPTQVSGVALAFGRAVERVEVKVGDADWVPANGTGSWTFDWDPTGLPTNQAVTIKARASAGNASGETEILVTPVEAPTIPLAIEEVVPDEAFAGRPQRFGARVTGDAPLTATLFYKPQGASSFIRLPLSRQGDLFSGTIPSSDVREGDLLYYFEAQSGLLVAHAGGDAESPSVIEVQPAPRLAVSIHAPPLVEATAGAETRFELNVTNVGSEPATFRVSASGLRSSWVHVPPQDIALAAGESRSVTASLTAPAAAFADNTTLTFEVRDTSGLAEPAVANVPVQVHAADGAATPTSGQNGRGSVIPISPIAALAAFAAAALVLRRRSR